MAMTMQELFYGPSEPTYFAHYGRQASVPSSHIAYQIPPPEPRVRRTELITFDLMVPMCCSRCEDEVRRALFALGTVRDVVCDPRNQRVIVTGCVDPAQALKQVRRVNNAAAFWSDASAYSAHRYEAASHQKSHRIVHQENRDRRVHVQSDAREQRSHPGQYSRNASSDAYSRSFCPAYRDTAKTYFVSLDPKIETVEEKEF